MTRQCLCEKCGETDQKEFYLGKKNICKTCLSEKNKKEKEEMQKLLEKAMSPKVKTPRAMSPVRNDEKLFEAQNLKIAFLETQILELNEKINNLYSILEKREEVQSVKIISPVKCEFPLPLPVVQEKVKSPPKVKTEKGNNLVENLPSMTTQELRELAKELGVPIPLNKRRKEDMINLISEKLNE